MNPMQNKTPEERKAIAAKGHATARARREAEDAARRDALKYAGDLREKIAALELKLAAMERMETMHTVSAAVTGKALLRAEEIAEASLPWSRASGVYFLLDGDEIVYVGQAVNVYSRIGQHTNKRFDRYAFVPCAVNELDKLESLYIHCLRPRLNGNLSNDAKHAPIALGALIGAVSNTQVQEPAVGRSPGTEPKTGRFAAKHVGQRNTTPSD
jgi:hypothetical protein